MDGPATFDDRLKQAQIEKTQAETEKLRREAAAVDRQIRGAGWTEPLKLFGAAILGAGGVVAAFTQYEVAELKARAAQHEMALAERARGEADAAAKLAVERQRQAETQAAQAAASAASAARLRDGAEAAASAASRRLADAEQRARAAQLELATARAGAAEAHQLKEAALAERRRIEAALVAMRGELGQLSNRLETSQREIVQARTKLEQEVLGGLQPQAADLALKLLERARDSGIELRLIAGYRSREQQEALFAKGRTEPGNIVTQARVSVHNTGLAFDVVVLVDGKGVFEDRHYTAVGAIGKTLGLVWGGDQRLPDRPHFETSDAQQALRALRSGN